MCRRAGGRARADEYSAGAARHGNHGLYRVPRRNQAGMPISRERGEYSAGRREVSRETTKAIGFLGVGLILGLLASTLIPRGVATVHWMWKDGANDTLTMKPGECVELRAQGPTSDGYGYESR